jgi:aminoacyl tRNA synthase complex-interacting multifunctional protein 1
MSASPLIVGLDALGAGIAFAARSSKGAAGRVSVVQQASVSATPLTALTTLAATSATASSAATEGAAYVVNDVVPAFATQDKKALFHFNSHLLLRPYVDGVVASVNDLVLVPVVRPVVAQWAPRDQLIFGNIVRWFNHVQHLPDVLAEFPTPLALVEDVPPPAKKDAAKPANAPTDAADAADAAPKKDAPKESKKKDAAPAKDAPPAAAAAAVVAAAAAEADTGAGKKKSGKGGAAAAPPAERPIDDVSRLLLLVGKIVDVKKHPDADSLYIEQIDCGEASGPRTVVSGLVKYVPIEEMQNRLVVIVANLKPANLKGIKSFGMVLCGKNADGTVVEPIDPPAGTKIGERVAVDGATGDADESIDAKKKTWPEIQAGLQTNDKREATHKGAVFRTSAGVVTCKTIANGTVS